MGFVLTASGAMAQLTRGRTKRKHLDSPSAEDPHCKAARQVQGSEEVVEHDAAQLVKSLGRLNLPGGKLMDTLAVKMNSTDIFARNSQPNLSFCS